MSQVTYQKIFRIPFKKISKNKTKQNLGRIFSTQKVKLICTILPKIFNAKLVIKSISKLIWVPAEMAEHPAGLLRKLRNSQKTKQRYSNKLIMGWVLFLPLQLFVISFGNLNGYDLLMNRDNNNSSVNIVNFVKMGLMSITWTSQTVN